MGLSRILLYCVLCSCLVCALSVPALGQTPAPAGVPTDDDPFFGSCTRTTQWQFEQVSATHLRLTGQVQIECPQMSFFADAIDVFTDPVLRLVASGNVVFTNPEGRIAAERVEFNVAKGTGTFHQASGIMSLGAKVDRAQFGNQEPEVYFYGDTIEKLDQRRYRLTRGGFTTCVQPTPRWEVASSSVIITLDDYAIARNTVLRVKGVPLMYLPVLYYPIKGDERATGFLLPTYGSSTLRGQTLSNAFFWAIGRSQDATLFHDWFTKVGQGAGGEYRYVASEGSYGNFRFYRFAQRQAEFRQRGTVARLPAESSYQFTGTGTQALGTSIRLHQRIDYSTSLVTQQLYQQSLYRASNATRTIESGLAGTWGGLTASALFQRTETFTGTNTSQLYGSTPRVTAALAPKRVLGYPVYSSLNADYAYLPYKTLRSNQGVSDRSLARVDVLPGMQVALSRLSFLTLNSTASYRTTYYNRSADSRDPLLRRYLTQRTEVIGPVFARIWDTPNSRVTERMKHLIEPTFALDYISNIGTFERVPILTDTSDRVVGGSFRFTYGLNNRLFLRTRTADASPGNTVQFLTIGVQQTYYGTKLASQSDTRYASSGAHPKPVDLSAVALTIRATPSAAFDSNARLEYDVHGNGLQVFTTGATTRRGRSSAGFAFSRSRATRTSKLDSSLGASTTLNVLEGRATGGYSLTWDIGRAAILDQSVAFSYLAQCCGIQVEFQKFKYPRANPNFPIPSDRRFNVSFVLAGLGTFSNFLGAFGGLMGVGP